MDTLGKSYIRPRQTYPHSWTGRAAPPPKHPTLTAPGKKGRSSKKGGCRSGGVAHARRPSGERGVWWKAMITPTGEVVLALA